MTNETGKTIRESLEKIKSLCHTHMPFVDIREEIDREVSEIKSALERAQGGRG